MLLIKEAKQLYIKENKLEIELKENVFAMPPQLTCVYLPSFGLRFVLQKQE
jgi:hypothetical protein